MILLTPRQAAVLVFIKAFRAQKGYSPSHREIAARFGFSSVNSVTGCINVLVAKGVVTRAAGKFRTLMVA